MLIPGVVLDKGNISCHTSKQTISWLSAIAATNGH